jgi:hypothetical protein
MPLEKDPAGAAREHPRYCTFCFSDGRLHAEQAADLAAFQASAYGSMRARGVSWLSARLFVFAMRFAPYWRGRRSS